MSRFKLECHDQIRPVEKSLLLLNGGLEEVKKESRY